MSELTKSQQKALDALRNGERSASKWDVSSHDARVLMRKGYVEERRRYPGGSGSMYGYRIKK